MDDDECIHCLGPVSACVICNGRAERDAKAEAETSWRTFPAKYAGTCRACSLPIFEGQIIAWKPDTTPVHAECTP